jgi:hypothetical protein
MKVHQLTLNEKQVLVFDAPNNATHGFPAIADGARYNIYRKGKVLDCDVFDKTQDDAGLIEKYNNKFVNVGQLGIADEGLVADLFIPVKNGNFYDYEYNGIFYPNAISTLRDIIEVECGFTNPFILILNP